MVLLCLIFPFLLFVLMLMLDNLERRLLCHLQKVRPQGLATDLVEGEDAENEPLLEQRPEQPAPVLAAEHSLAPEEELRQHALFRVGGSTIWLSRPARGNRRTTRARLSRQLHRRENREPPWRHAA